MMLWTPSRFFAGGGRILGAGVRQNGIGADFLGHRDRTLPDGRSEIIDAAGTSRNKPPCWRAMMRGRHNRAWVGNGRHRHIEDGRDGKIDRDHGGPGMIDTEIHCAPHIKGLRDDLNKAR